MTDDGLSVCQDGTFLHPRVLPLSTSPAVLREMAIAAASAGAPPSLHSQQDDKSKEGNGRGDEGGHDSKKKKAIEELWREVKNHPPLWQEQKPSTKAVVTKEDFKTFQHFWLANEEKRLLVIAIPKVRSAAVVHFPYRIWLAFTTRSNVYEQLFVGASREGQRGTERARNTQGEADKEINRARQHLGIQIRLWRCV